MSNLIGQSIDRYHVLEQLGEGGMATVYKAYDTRLERDVAVKVIQVDQFTPASLQGVLARFEREAKSLARLSHPNIVKVMDYGEYQGAPYLVLEYLPSGTLKERLGQPLPWAQAARLLLPMAEALAFAHEHGIIHRDVKPSNILLTEKGQPMLTDFGVAKILSGSGETVDLTGVGIGIGTPQYMSLEQFQGQGVDGRTDIYSLGVVLYEMVTGRRPYDADTPAAVMLKQASEPLPQARKFAPDLPDAVDKILLKALAKKPEDRYQNMDEFAVALEGLKKGSLAAQDAPPGRRRSAGWIWGLAGLLVLIIAATTWVVAGRFRPPLGVYAVALPPADGLTLAPPPTQAVILARTNTPADTPPVLTSTSSPQPPVRISAENVDRVQQLNQFDTIAASVAFSPDGGTLASGSWKGILRLWRISDGSFLSLEGHSAGVNSVAFSPDGQTLASGSSDGTVRLWRASDGSLLRILGENLGTVYSVAFSPDGETLASGSSDGTVQLWRLSDGSRLLSLAGHQGRVYSVALSPDGRTLASGSGDRTVRLWRVSDGSLLHTLRGHTHVVNSVAFSPDGQILASGSADTSLRLWQVSDGTLLQKISEPEDEVVAVAFSPDGETVASGSKDGTLQLWLALNGSLLRTLKGHTNWIRSIAFSPDGQMLASGSDDGTVLLWGVLP